MKSLGFVLAGALVLGTAGCADPKEASKGNFEKAINDWIGTNPPCLSIPGSSIKAADSDAPFPRFVDASPVTAKYAVESRQRQLAPFDAMVDAGLLRVEETTIKAKSGWGNDVHEVPVRSYDLTEAGKNALTTKGEKTAFLEPSQQFCYGKPQVDEIVQFTEPGDAMGMKVAQVSYRYHLGDLPQWAKNQKMRAAFPQLERDSKDSIDAKAAVILTNEGWVHERAMAR
jgi:hypothetical protein